MTDYGHQIEAGVFLSPDTRSPRRVVEHADLADVSGYDLITVQDHPYNAGQVDCLTLLTLIAARTSSARVAPNVACLPLRPPAGLAKAMATIYELSDGRAELGLGAGAFWDPIVAAGGPRRSPKQAVDALVEAIAILRACWSGETVHVDGEHYRVDGLRPGPVPAQQIPIWLGAYKPRMLRLTGSLADAWVPSMGYADPAALAALNAQIDEAALAAGRDPSQIKRIYNIFGEFGSGSGFLRGRPADWAEQLAALVLEDGMTTFILGGDDATLYRTFAGEVMPALRDLVDDERALAASRPSPRADVPVTRPAEPAVLDTAHLPVPTPDDGHRLTGDLGWDEATRPVAASHDLAGFSAARLAAPQHLLDIHNALRAELDQVRAVVEQVQQGQTGVGRARSIINTMALRQNNWTLGTYCESYCRIVTGHHALEDRSVFPHLLDRDPALAPVIERLEAEHEVIADDLELLDRSLVELVGVDPQSPGALDGVRHAVDRLTDTLLSHLSYEERELFEPLARFGFQ